MHKKDKCPHCNVSLLGDPIPKNSLKCYNTTHWRREIGIDGGYIGIYDGIVAYKCPDCEKYFPRDQSDWAQKLFNEFMEKIK